MDDITLNLVSFPKPSPSASLPAKKPALKPNKAKTIHVKTPNNSSQTDIPLRESEKNSHVKQNEQENGKGEKEKFGITSRFKNMPLKTVRGMQKNKSDL